MVVTFSYYARFKIIIILSSMLNHSACGKRGWVNISQFGYYDHNEDEMKHWIILFALMPALSYAGDQLEIKAHSAKFDMKVVAFGNAIIVKRQDNGKSLRCRYSEKIDSVDGKSLEPVTIWDYNKCNLISDGDVTPVEGLISIIKTLSSKQYELIIIGPDKFIPVTELSLSYPLTDVQVKMQ